MYKYEYERDNNVVSVYDDELKLAEMKIRIKDDVALLDIYEFNVDSEFNHAFSVLSTCASKIKELLNEEGVPVDYVRVGSFAPSESREMSKNSTAKKVNRR